MAEPSRSVKKAEVASFSRYVADAATYPDNIELTQCTATGKAPADSDIASWQFVFAGKEQGSFYDQLVSLGAGPNVGKIRGVTARGDIAMYCDFAKPADKPQPAPEYCSETPAGERQFDWDACMADLSKYSANYYSDKLVQCGQKKITCE